VRSAFSVDDHPREYFAIAVKPGDVVKADLVNKGPGARYLLEPLAEAGLGDVRGSEQDDAGASLTWRARGTGILSLAVVAAEEVGSGRDDFTLEARIKPGVPDLIGLNGKEAWAALRASGHTGSWVREFDDTVPAGQVVSQKPKPGAETPRGAGVSYVLSLGPMPDAGDEPDTSQAVRIIELEQDASLRILRDGRQIRRIAVTPGERVLFRIDNTAGFAHNFYIGRRVQLRRPNGSTDVGIPDWDSGVQEFEWTVPANANTLSFGCTIPGHFALERGRFVIR
jgi:hypothetical protein